MAREVKPLILWMAKAQCLAPGWGITFTKREMRERLRTESPRPEQYRIVQVIVTEMKKGQAY
jgi:hypothetical protein